MSVVRSANVKRCAAMASSLLFVCGLCGCVETTQQKNARAQLQADRLLASRESVHVMRRNPNVVVVKVALLRGNSGTAIAVMLRNNATSPTSDLPISVGITTHNRHAVYLNRKPELAYFQTHVAAIAGGGLVTWVFVSPRVVASSDRPFATVGQSALRIGTGVRGLPRVTGSLALASPSAHGRLLVNATVTNHSDLPQYGLEVYAYTLSGDHFLAAGRAPVTDLQSGRSATVTIRLIGNPGRATLHLDVPPTILQ
jgi:hypothetical protein